MSTNLKQTESIICSTKGVRFASKLQIETHQDNDNPVMVTYDSGADGKYASKGDRLKSGMPILRRSTKQVDVANAGTRNGKRDT